MNSSHRWLGGVIVIVVLAVIITALTVGVSLVKAFVGYATPLRYSIPKYMRNQLLQCGLPAFLATDALAAALCDHLLFIADLHGRARQARGQIIADAMDSCERLSRMVVDMAFAEQPAPADWLRLIMTTHHLLRADGAGACFSDWHGHGS